MMMHCDVTSLLLLNLKADPIFHCSICVIEGLLVSLCEYLYVCVSQVQACTLVPLLLGHISESNSTFLKL